MEVISAFQGNINEINKINYNKKNKAFSIDIFDFKFVGLYKKSTKLGRILDDIHNLLKALPFERDDFFIVNLNYSAVISEKKKLSSIVSDNDIKFSIGLKQLIRLYSGKPGRPREIKFVFPTKMVFSEILNTIMKWFQIDENTLEYFEITAKETTLSRERLFDEIGPRLFEDVIIEIGNIFGLRMNKQAAEEHPDIYNRVYGRELVPSDVDLRATTVGLLSVEKEMDKDITTEEKKVMAAVSKPPPPPSPQPAETPAALLKAGPETGGAPGGPPPPAPKAAPPAPAEAPAKPVKALVDDSLDFIRDIKPAKKKEKISEERRAEPSRAKKMKMDEFKAEAEPSEMELAEEFGELEGEAGPQPTTYDIKMGLQYYSVMMEEKSYLFYMYFSHEELKIEDEEGKVVFETHFTITTIKEEPPVLDIKVGGEGFEVHPLNAKLLVDKDAVNPPVMIFSVLPLKSEKNKTKEEKKRGEKRFLNVLVDFENKTICHVVLAVTILPKHFHLDLGPIHLNINKGTAIAISVASFAWAAFSIVYSLLTFDPSSFFTDLIGGFFPSLISILWVVLFLVTLFRGLYPLKQQWSDLMNFGKTSGFEK